MNKEIEKKDRICRLKENLLRGRKICSYKIWLYRFVYFIILFFVILWFYRYHDVRSWLDPAAIFLFMLFTFLFFILSFHAVKYGYNFMYNLDADKISEKEAPLVYERVHFLSAKANIPAPLVYYSDEKYITAFSAGWSLQTSIIVLNRNIVSVLNIEELDSVIAHEIAHIKNQDYRSRIMWYFGAGLSIKACERVVRWITGGNKSISKKRDPHELLIIYIFTLIWLPIFIIWAGGMSVIVKRIIIEQEYRADCESALLLLNTSVLSQALLKLEKQKSCYVIQENYIEERIESHLDNDGSERIMNPNDDPASFELILDIIGPPEGKSLLWKYLSVYPSLPERIKKLDMLASI